MLVVCGVGVVDSSGSLSKSYVQFQLGVVLLCFVFLSNLLAFFLVSNQRSDG